MMWEREKIKSIIASVQKSFIIVLHNGNLDVTGRDGWSKLVSLVEDAVKDKVYDWRSYEDDESNGIKWFNVKQMWKKLCKLQMMTM